jgi:aminomethyltransferase
MVDFAGWNMPISYGSGAIEEHRLVRRSAGLFDVSHMGQFLISGPGALDYVQRLVSPDLLAVAERESTYALLCRDDGGVLDDLFLYNLPGHWLVVVNAANREKDLAWFTRHLPAGNDSVRLRDASDELAMLAFQGPEAIGVMDRLTDGATSRIPRFGAAQLPLSGLPAPAAGRALTIGRTGYTGEDGVELFVPAEVAVAVWERILAESDAAGVEAGPIGLAARDSLRFEPGFPLYGHELTEEITPVEARLTWACDLEQDFIGRDAIVARKKERPDRRLATIRLTERGVPREGYRVLSQGREVGVVVTGMYAPSVDAGCANVFMESSLAKPGTEVDIEIRGRARQAVVVKRPLYTPAYR